MSTGKSLAVIETQDDSLLAAISAAARDPQVDAAKINALLEIKIKIDALEAENKFWDAMRECQNEMEPIRKDAMNLENKGKYAKVSTIQRIIQPIYRKHNFNLSFTAKDQDDANVVPLACIVSHACGHRQVYTLKATIDDKGPKGGGVKTQVQGTMSTSSYLRRKLYELIFDLILTDDDDDGSLGKGKKPITQDQADTITSLLAACGMKTSEQRRGFFAYCTPDGDPTITSVSQIPAFKYDKAIVALQAKERQMK